MKNYAKMETQQRTGAQLRKLHLDLQTAFLAVVEGLP